MKIVDSGAHRLARQARCTNECIGGERRKNSSGNTPASHEPEGTPTVAAKNERGKHATTSQTHTHGHSHNFRHDQDAAAKSSDKAPRSGEYRCVKPTPRQFQALQARGAEQQNTRIAAGRPFRMGRFPPSRINSPGYVRMNSEGATAHDHPQEMKAGNSQRRKSGCDAGTVNEAPHPKVEPAMAVPVTQLAMKIRAHRLEGQVPTTAQSQRSTATGAVENRRWQWLRPKAPQPITRPALRTGQISFFGHPRAHLAPKMHKRAFSTVEQPPREAKAPWATADTRPYLRDCLAATRAEASDQCAIAWPATTMEEVQEQGRSRPSTVGTRHDCATRPAHRFEGDPPRQRCTEGQSLAMPLRNPKHQQRAIGDDPPTAQRHAHRSSREMFRSASSTAQPATVADDESADPPRFNPPSETRPGL